MNLRGIWSKIKKMGLSVLPGRGDNRETGARPVQSRCRKEQLFSTRSGGAPVSRASAAAKEAAAAQLPVG